MQHVSLPPFFTRHTFALPPIVAKEALSSGSEMYTWRLDVVVTKLILFVYYKKSEEVWLDCHTVCNTLAQNGCDEPDSQVPPPLHVQEIHTQYKKVCLL
jgi:uncharacterized protein YijF (DUF1287 family)